jgi:hypothetical protein
MNKVCRPEYFLLAAIVGITVNSLTPVTAYDIFPSNCWDLFNFRLFIRALLKNGGIIMDEKEKPVNNHPDKKSADDQELMSLLNEMESVLDKEEDIIELTDLVDNPEVEESDIIIKDLDDGTEIDSFQKDDFAASLGLKIDDGVGLSGDISETVELDLGRRESEKIPVSEEQLEEAIERVVQKMLGEKIDGILYKVIERAVSQEIIRLKNILRVNEEDID